MKNEQNTIEKNLEVFNTYLKEKNELFNIAKIETAKQESLKLQRSNLDHSLKIGQLISVGLNEFNSPEAKQERKNLGLKISVEYFIKMAYGYAKRQAYYLKDAYELPADVKKDYRNSSILEADLSIKGLLRFANPKADVSEAETSEAEVSEAETSEAEVSENQQNKFGGVTITLTKASKSDIEQAIAYLTNLVK